MGGDAWPDEPEEPFAEYRDPFPEYRNPFPQYTEPIRPRRRAEGSKTDESVPPALQSGLLALLGVVRIGLFALALGPMLVFLGGDRYYGTIITAIGVVTCTYAAHRYLVYRDLRQKL
ncbi:DUF7322 domain-containing protein [Halorientalis salina]|uniref:DUF7322 domain-containing protein n=1 Tax=Halorientalis salina TaxID=2932266 RepID=UPI0010AD3224|nr:hypothetical protein [Halorientalis salina]